MESKNNYGERIKGNYYKGKGILENRIEEE